MRPVCAWLYCREVQLAGQYSPQGVRLELAVPQGCTATLDRLLIKSDTATVSIPGGGSSAAAGELGSLHRNCVRVHGKCGPLGYKKTCYPHKAQNDAVA